MDEYQYPAVPQVPQGYPAPPQAAYPEAFPQAVPTYPPQGTPYPQQGGGYPPAAPYPGWAAPTVQQSPPGPQAWAPAPYPYPAAQGAAFPPVQNTAVGTAAYPPAPCAVSYGTPPAGAPAACAPVPPPFAIGGTRAPRDPRRHGASRTLNRMCVLVVGQTAATFFWEFLLVGLMTICGVSIYTDEMAYLWLSTALVPLATALPFFLYLLFTKADLSQYLRFQKVGLPGGILCVLGGLAVCLLANYPAFFVQDLLGNFGYEPTVNPFVQGDSWQAILLELLSTAVLVPVMEEFAFRGVLLSSLRKYGAGFAVTASALVFSLVHLDFANVIFAFVAGLVFGFLYARTNNLWLTIWIHALNNGIAVLTSHTDFLFGDWAGFADGALMLVPIILGVVAVVLLLVFKRGLLFTRGMPQPECPAKPLASGESAACIARAPVFWAVVGMMLLYTVSLFL